MSLPFCLRPWLALAGLAGALGAAVPTASAAEFWVSPQGDDSSNGSAQAPWRTLQHARDFLRDSGLNRTMQEDLVINLAAGEYPVDAPIQFGPGDSGENGHAIVYRSAAGPGAACFVGAAPVAGWTPERNGIWKAKVPRGSLFRTLYENDRRGRIARSPNYAPDARYPGYLGGYLNSEGGAAGSITYRAGDLDPSRWSDSAGAEVWWWGNEGKRNWGIYPCPITAIDPASRKIAFVRGGSPAAAGERYFIQGPRELLDAPGEFFLDSPAGLLYYYPLGGDPNTRTILAPKVSEVFHLDGGQAGSHVHDLKFIGLAVRGTDYVADSVVTVGSPRAAFFLNHTDHIELRDCHLFQLGNLAVRILDDSDHDTVAGCWIERTGEGGIQVYNDLTQKQFPGRRSEHHLISDCLIHDFSEVRVSTHWCGVQLFCVDESEVSHCVIFNSGRYAISLRGNYSTQTSEEWVAARYPSYGNRFAYLDLSHGGGDSGDMGLMHAAHCNPTGGTNINTWEQITISHVHAHPSMDDVPPDGIFFDHPHSCENQIVRNVKVTDVQGLAFRTNHNPQQTLDNVSWMPGFSEKAMEYAKIGLTADFPSAYGGPASDR